MTGGICAGKVLLTDGSSDGSSRAGLREAFPGCIRIVHSLPKNGVYRSSHEVMLRFYSFYKQATCGPCTAPGPGSGKSYFAMVINTVPMNEKTASMFHYFQPLYSVIHDMPRPPDTLLQQTGGELESSVREEWSGESEPQGNGPVWGLSGHPDGGAEFNQESNHVTSDSESEVFCDSMEQLDPDKGLSCWLPALLLWPFLAQWLIHLL